MQRLVILSILFLVVLLCACSDDSVSPSEIEDDTSKEKNKLAIVSVDQDSVYWGDTVIVRLAHATSDSFSVFLHTAPVIPDSIWKEPEEITAIRFRVVSGAGTGRVRVFDSRSIEAKGSFWIETLPSPRPFYHHMRTSFSYIAYRDDLLVIEGDSLPLRWRDIEMRIGNVTLTVLQWGAKRIVARIGSDVQTGPLTIRLLNWQITYGVYTILEHTDELLSEGRLSEIMISYLGCQGIVQRSTFTNEDTNVFHETSSTNEAEIRSLEPTACFAISDSIVCISDKITRTGLDSTIYRVEIRLKREPESRASGVIRFVDTSIDRAGRRSTRYFEVQVSGIRWRRENGRYVLYTQSVDLPEQLLSYFYRQSSPTGSREMRSTRDSKRGSQLAIVLTP